MRTRVGGSLWTRAAGRELLRLVTGVVMTERGVGTWLRRHGVPPPRPARRAYQQQEKKVQAWLAEQDPVIAAHDGGESRAGRGGPVRTALGHGAAWPLLGAAGRHPGHRSQAVRAWLDNHADRVELHLRPDDSPDRNPDELRNADITRHGHASRTPSADDLAHQTRRFLRRRQHHPHIVRGYVHARPVRYTIM